MHNEFTAIIEQENEWYIAYCPEIPGANGQGKTQEEARKSLAEAIALILEDRRGGRPAWHTTRCHPRHGDHRVKRSALLRHLRKNGCFLKREGGAHSLWMNPSTGAVEAVPRHSEIADLLARKICQNLSLPIIGK